MKKCLAMSLSHKFLISLNYWSEKTNIEIDVQLTEFELGGRSVGYSVRYRRDVYGKIHFQVFPRLLHA